MWVTLLESLPGKSGGKSFWQTWWVTFGGKLQERHRVKLLGKFSWNRKLLIQAWRSSSCPSQ